MAGIYLHIPFCKKACHYCDFHFSTNLDRKDRLLSALSKELRLRKNYLNGERVRTVYFGGGTPSLLTGDELNRLLDTIHEAFDLDQDAEITLEANPDDLDRLKVRELRSTAVNRLSIGVQSFFEEDLIWMNRSHTALQAADSIKRVQDAGIENITADLIYGFALLSDQKWKANLEQMVALQVRHISAYSMTVEAKTALATFIRKGVEKPMDESRSAEQFLLLCELLEAAGFQQYEVSNFARPGYVSRHNSNYWKGEAYLGAGPAAHSFDKKSRQWNLANNAAYVHAVLDEGRVPFERETLDTKTRVNEHIMTGLRTIWGLDLKQVEELLGQEGRTSLEKSATIFIGKGQMRAEGDALLLTDAGKLYADRIAAELFL